MESNEYTSVDKILVSLVSTLIAYLFGQRYYRYKLFKECKNLFQSYRKSPKQAEETYASSIVMFRYRPSIEKIRKFQTPIFREAEQLTEYFNKCKNSLNGNVKRSILATLDTVQKLNGIQVNLDFNTSDLENLKNQTRQYVIDWCYVVTMLERLGKHKNKSSLALNHDRNTFNDVSQKKLGVTLNENELFEKRMHELGYKLNQSINNG